METGKALFLRLGKWLVTRKSEVSKKRKIFGALRIVIASGLVFFLLHSQAHASSTSGSGMTIIWTDVSTWMQGSIGKVVALGLAIYGLFEAFKSHLMWFAIGMAGAVLIYEGPNIINAIFGAVI